MHQSKYVYFNEVLWFMVMKMRLKMKNRPHRYNINRPRPRHVKVTSKMYLIIMMVKLKTWSSVHEKFKQHWGWVEKKRCL